MTEQQLENKILEILRAHPGLRAREFGVYGGYPRWKMVQHLSTMEQKGLVYSVNYRDAANMEFYNKWYAVCD